LVKFEVDDSYYACPRIKVLTDGRVRIGETYNVVWGKSDDDSDLVDIFDSGDWLDMRKKMSEIEQDSSSPLHQTNRKMPASNSNGPSKNRKLRQTSSVSKRGPQSVIRTSFCQNLQYYPFT